MNPPTRLYRIVDQIGKMNITPENVKGLLDKLVLLKPLYEAHQKQQQPVPAQPTPMPMQVIQQPIMALPTMPAMPIGMGIPMQQGPPGMQYMIPKGLEPELASVIKFAPQGGRPSTMTPFTPTTYTQYDPRPAPPADGNAVPPGPRAGVPQPRGPLMGQQAFLPHNEPNQRGFEQNNMGYAIPGMQGGQDRRMPPGGQPAMGGAPGKPRNYKTVPCRLYHSDLGCDHGDSCHFIHDAQYQGRETPNMGKYVRPIGKLSKNEDKNRELLSKYYTTRQNEPAPQPQYMAAPPGPPMGGYYRPPPPYPGEYGYLHDSF